MARPLDRALLRVLPALPRPLVRRVAERYIAGEELADACRVARRLNQEGMLATIDVLGEETRTVEEARAVATAYREVLHAIDRERLDANVSVKLTALGLHVDLDLCRQGLRAVVDTARTLANFVRIDMEDSRCTDPTLSLYRELRQQGYHNVGIVLQAALRRTLDDVRALADLRPNVRLCKGAYVEPAEIAFQDDEEVRRNFVAAHAALLDAGSYVALATHDERLISEGLRLVRERGLAREEYELQFLLGVRPQRARELVGQGHRLRVYVPFGQRWYEYSLRRMHENPKLAGEVALDTLRRLVLRGRA